MRSKVLAKTLLFLASLLWFAGITDAQTGTIGSATDGMTPSAIAPGSYDFMNVNPYNGKLSVALPLLKVGGRGVAGYTMTLPIDQTWTARQFTIAYQCMNATCPGPATYYNATLNWWTGTRPGFTAGVVQGRRVGGFDTQPGSPAPDLWGVGHRYFPATVSGGNNIVVIGTRETLSRLTFIGPDNSEIELRDQLTAGRPNSAPCNNQTPGFNRGQVFVSSDGSGITFVSDSDILDIDCSGAYPIGMTANSNVFGVSGYLHFKNGTVYRIDGAAVSWIRDADGNQTTFPAGGGVIDPLGRQITFSTGSDYTQVNYTGFAATPRTLRVYYSWLSSDLRSDQTIKTYHQLFPEIYNETDSPGPSPFDTGGLISAVQLPDGRFYRFYYNSYAELARVELPTGGAIEYDYAAGYDLPTHYSGVLGSANKEIYRRVAESRLYPNGGTGNNFERRTTYSHNSSDSDSYYSSLASGFVTVDERDANGTLLARTKHYYYGSPVASLFLGWDSPATYSSWKEGREYQTEIFAQDGTTLLRRVNHDWQQKAPVSWWSSWCQQQGSFCSSYSEPPNDPRVIRTTITLADSNLVTKEEFAYDQFNNQTDMWEYDFGVSAPPQYPTRHTHTEYLTTNNGLDYTSVDAHLRSLPRLAQVYAVNTSNGSETMMAQTELFYDESAYPTIQYGTVAGWNAPATAARGNVTTTRRWLNFNGSTLSSFPDGTYPATHAQYDQCGNVRYAWDAKGNQSQISYSDSFSDGMPRNTYAYPTSTTTAVPDPTGAYGSTAAFSTSTVYDFNSGLVTSASDPNGQTTSYTYSDPLNRVKTVTRPDGGVTTYNYGDSLGSLYVETLTKQDSTRNIDAYQFFDGLGRPNRSFLGVGGGNYHTSDTQYDNMGRVYRVSNPYLSTGSASTINPAGLWTTNAYDALGRLLTVTTPDNAVMTTAYGASTSGTLGATVLVRDQAGKERISKTNAPGQLTDVWEVTAPESGVTESISFPGHTEATAGYHTNYTYDVLGNLRRVDQGTQHRYFLYDSLSRLIRARNPEQLVNSSLNLTDSINNNDQWSMSYAYDDNGNLLTRTDARNITTTYTYDQLNRNTTIRYSNDSQYTHRVDRYYDGAGVPNGKGRLWKTASTEYVPAGRGGILMLDGCVTLAINGYDALGRPTGQEQKMFFTGMYNYQSWSQPYTVQRSYDLAGQVISQTYPSGHTVNYSYDLAGRLADKVPQSQNAQDLAFSGNLGDGVTRTYSSGIGYDEVSRMKEEKYGTLTPLYHKQHFNVRGQLYDVRLSTVAGQTDQWNGNRGAIVNWYDSTSGYPYQNPNSGTDNNGNLIRSEVFIPVDEQGSSYNFTRQAYSYDKLNRLTSVAEFQNGATPSFTQSYTYDRWGNRTIDQSGTTQNAGINSIQTSIDTETNRLYAQGDLNISDPNQRLVRYDPAGNQTHDYFSPNWNGSRAYDAENRMVTATDTNNQTSKYTYDADGHRVRRIVAGVETWQVYGFEGELLAEYAKGGASFVPQKEYGYRNGQLLITAANGDEGRLNNFIQNFYLRFGVPSDGSQQTRVNALANAGNQGGLSQLFAEAQNQAQAIISQSNIASDTDYVTALYLTYCQRYPDSGGLSYWVPVVASQGRNAVRDAFAAPGGEFSARVDNLWGASASDNERTDAFVQYMYQAILHRWASVSEDTAAISTFDNAGATGQANVVSTAGTWARGLFNSSEYTSRPGLTPHDFVYDLYQAFLRYAPDQGGWDWWTSQVGSNWQNKQGVMDAFINAGPYAQQAGTLYREILWLTPDHLGTPRMIAERTGSLAGIKRHDYLPFGEELFAGQGGRTTAQGYFADNIRQKFTRKERDNETGLDYFLARYYSSTQGRFTSPDPLSAPASAHPNIPQSWNLYAYVLNNPLKLVDPDGMMWIYHFLDKEHKRIGITWIDGNKIPRGYHALNFGGARSRDVTLVDGSVVRLKVNTNRAEFLQGPQKSSGDGGYVNTGLIRELGRQTAPMPAATVAFILLSINGGYAIAGSSIALLDAAAFALNAVHEQSQNDAEVMATVSQYDQEQTKPGSIRNVYTDVSKSEFIKNMEASGYKVTRSGNATILDNGSTRYTVYDVATSTKGPTAVRSIGGEQTMKIRLKP